MRSKTSKHRGQDRPLAMLLHVEMPHLEEDETMRHHCLAPSMKSPTAAEEDPTCLGCYDALAIRGREVAL